VHILKNKDEHKFLQTKCPVAVPSPSLDAIGYQPTKIESAYLWSFRVWWGGLLHSWCA